MSPKIILRIHCWWAGHDWENDDDFPTHGYRDVPFPESYCKNCGITGKQYLGIKE